MKPFRKLSLTITLVLILTISALAGDISTTRTGDMSTTKTGDMHTGVTAADVVVRTVGLYQSLLAVL